MTVDRSPLAGFADRFSQASVRSEGRLSVVENPQWQQVNLRIAPADAHLLADALGGPLPADANTVTPTANGLTVWLGPDEWLLLSPERHLPMNRLRAAAGSAPVSVVDVSAARTVITIGGPAARDVLAHGCALDLDPGRFPPGSCAQTRLALANVVLIAPPDQPGDFPLEPRFHLLVRSSFAAYLGTWLLDAATEYVR